MKIHELLADESKWTKGFYAKTASGKHAYSHDKEAACWCVSGAIQRCYELADRQDVYARFKAALPADYRGQPIANWNDAPTTTFADVRALALELDI